VPGAPATYDKEVTMNANGKIAVVGGTGRVGRHVVDVLRERGHKVVSLSRSSGVDVITTKGLADALAGVRCVVDAATGPSPEQEAATEFFTTAGRNLHEIGERAGVSRIVVVSIIGCDRFTGGYSAAKRAHEEATLEGPLPATILRAAQFHEFVGQLVDWGRQGEVSYVPRMRMQPVAARSVAEGLVDLATGQTTGLPGMPFREIAGPREESLVELAQLLVARRGDGLRIEAVSDPRDPDSALYENGALLPSTHATLAGPPFAEWLAAGTSSTPLAG
jgi:uncharacterized protein YbjT (DUF2867 family)